MSVVAEYTALGGAVGRRLPVGPRCNGDYAGPGSSEGVMVEQILEDLQPMEWVSRIALQVEKQRLGVFWRVVAGRGGEDPKQRMAVIARDFDFFAP